MTDTNAKALLLDRIVKELMAVRADRASRAPQRPAYDIRKLAKRASLPRYMYNTEIACDALSRLVAIVLEDSAAGNQQAAITERKTP